MKKFSVLLVEDNHVYAKLIQLLGSDKAQFTWCKNLQAANEAIKTQQFDIYLLDLYLPDGDSIEFCRCINTPKKEDTITVFISGETDLEWRLRAFEAGAENYIQKDISKELLKLKLDSLLDYQANRLLALKHAKNDSKVQTDRTFRTQLDHNALIHFYRQCLNLNDISKFSGYLSSLMESWELDYIARLKLTDGTEYHFKNNDEAICDMELELFNDLEVNSANVQSFGQSTFFKYQQAELIVKNMPTDSYSKGSLVDIFHYVVEAIDIRLNEIAKLQHMDSIIQEIKEHLKEREDDKSLSLLNELVDDLESITVEKDLSDDNDDMVFF
ncbi:MULTISPECIES: response regulator [Pseudoalteromonas]|uniref:Response regulator n=1 Tax=Pseudoalteromonas obscura TaxID=3048491 RepID=A0ABT7EEE8_9GAMM|nr:MULTISPECIES: response regulator [Pseudoalteromonas]MBQ4838611.1 response regulator [Pseudoalteromonas luteoviolacea]MDK2593656.1 response regulator [Pseudoalteromonas sp. P94(2023)]